MTDPYRDFPLGVECAWPAPAETGVEEPRRRWPVLLGVALAALAVGALSGAWYFGAGITVAQWLGFAVGQG
jgi:hypothetical protein